MDIQENILLQNPGTKTPNTETSNPKSLTLSQNCTLDGSSAYKILYCFYKVELNTISQNCATIEHWNWYVGNKMCWHKGIYPNQQPLDRRQSSQEPKKGSIATKLPSFLQHLQHHAWRKKKSKNKQKAILLHSCNATKNRF